MRRFKSATRSAGSVEAAGGPSVRYVYDRPLPYARHLRVEIVGPDGAVVSTLISSYEPGKGWVTQNAAVGTSTAA
ncbi:MAG TPA: hypothetical protein VNC22_07210 [Sporichthya sp.]|nr:hypothetical protein [Sporichthya sp.]